MFKRLSQKLLYRDKWQRFYQDEVEFPEGERGTYAYLKRNDGVGVVVLTGDKKILLQEEYRYVIDQYSWEIPGGGIDKGEDPHEAAKRELMEETGLKADKLEFLTKLYPLSSANTEQVYLFVAKIKEPVELTASGEEDELFRGRRWVKFDEAMEMIKKGQITDVMTVAAVLLVINVS